MSDLNIATITGRLVRDPIVRYAGSGNPWGVFTLATNYHYKDKGGEFKEEVAFVPGKAFGRMADSLSKHKKGEMALATGRLKTETWEKDGKTQSQLTLICDTLRFIVPQNGTSPSSDTAENEPHGGDTSNGKDDMPPF